MAGDPLKKWISADMSRSLLFSLEQLAELNVLHIQVVPPSSEQVVLSDVEYPEPARHQYRSEPSPYSIEDSPTLVLCPGRLIVFDPKISESIDQERFEKIGHLDKKSLAKSKKLIAEAVDEESIYFVDLSNLLEHKYFFDNNGHCVIEGRRKIAKALAPKVAEILNESPATPE